MKKKWLNRGFALGLTLVTAFGLCACGGEGKSMENAGMAKEHVYKLSQIEIPNLGVADGKGNTSIMQTLHKDEGFLSFCGMKVGILKPMNLL